MRLQSKFYPNRIRRKKAEKLLLLSSETTTAGEVKDVSERHSDASNKGELFPTSLEITGNTDCPNFKLSLLKEG